METPILPPTAAPGNPLPIAEITTELKATAASPGYKTTEFWVHIAVLVALIATAATGYLPPQYAAICGAVSQAAYSLSRGLSKQGNSH